MRYRIKYSPPNVQAGVAEAFVEELPSRLTGSTRPGEVEIFPDSTVPECLVAEDGVEEAVGGSEIEEVADGKKGKDTIQKEFYW